MTEFFIAFRHWSMLLKFQLAVKNSEALSLCANYKTALMQYLLWTYDNILIIKTDVNVQCVWL